MYFIFLPKDSFILSSIPIYIYFKLTDKVNKLFSQMVGSIWLEGIISQKSQADERAAMESATAIATEAVISIKTVQSLGKEAFSC